MQPFQPVVSPSPGAIAGWMSNTNPSLAHPAVAAAAPPGLVQPSSAGEDVCDVCYLNAFSSVLVFWVILRTYCFFLFDLAAAFLKHPRTPTGVTGMDYQSADSEHLIKRIRTGQSDEVREMFIFLTSCLNIMFSTRSSCWWLVVHSVLSLFIIPLAKKKKRNKRRKRFKKYAHHLFL